MSTVDPPDIRLASVVAEAGEAAVAAVERHLRTAKAELELVDLSEVLARMQRFGTYDVRGDRKLQRAFAERFDKAKRPDVLVMLRALARRIGWFG